MSLLVCREPFISFLSLPPLNTYIHECVCTPPHTYTDCTFIYLVVQRIFCWILCVIYLWKGNKLCFLEHLNLYLSKLRWKKEPGEVAQSCNSPLGREAVTRRLRVRSQPGPHSKTCFKERMNTFKIAPISYNTTTSKFRFIDTNTGFRSTAEILEWTSKDSMEYVNEGPESHPATSSHSTSGPLQHVFELPLLYSEIHRKLLSFPSMEVRMWERLFLILHLSLQGDRVPFSK